MIDNDPLWYKDAIIYEVHVRAFLDTDGDGIGDFRGLAQKLDYLEDLGVTAVWLLPFYPSPLKDDGYDIAEYIDVHPQYGKLADFREFLEEAHRRGIRVITELVINHTSDQHAWFQRARRSPPGSPERDFYVWSDTPERYKQARIIFKDFEHSNWAYDGVAGAYFWHRFYHHQPDLNYDNPAVWDALFPVLDFWLAMGVDGLRLDAIPYLYEREGTNCENLAETHAFLRALRAHLDKNFPGRMFLAEANQWPEDAVAYFGAGDECQMAFHFPLMPRLFMGLHQEDRFPILDILQQTPAIPPNCQWGLFLRNHDELTLEMVTDEERDYMYRAYADDRTARINLGIRRRLAPLLNNDRRRIELMNALLFSLPGTPVLYYGDEIGMGDNIYLGDRHGVRTPMQWSSDRNAGFSRANPQGLYAPVIIDPEYHYEAINVEAQQNNPASLLWWMKRLIALRKRHKAFGRGTLEFLAPANAKILAFLREYDGEHILVVANLSRFVQPVELDLSRWAGTVPEELFGRSHFPTVTDRPYPLTLGPHGFYWFALTPQQAVLGLGAPQKLPVLVAPADLDDLFENNSRDRVEALLPAYLQTRRPGGAPVPITAVHILQAQPFRPDGLRAWFLVVRLEFQVGIPEQMLLPLAVVPADRAAALLEPVEVAGVARVGDHVLLDALAVPEYGRAVLDMVAHGGTVRLGESELVAAHRPGFSALVAEGDLSPRLHRSERGTLTLLYGQRLVLKTLRRIEDGASPDLELGRYLHDRHFPHFAPIAGHIELRRRKRRAEPVTLAVLHRYVVNQGNAWQYTLDHLASFFEHVAALSPEPPEPPLGELIGGYAQAARNWASWPPAPDAGRGGRPGPGPEPFDRASQRRRQRRAARSLTGQLAARLRRQRSTSRRAARRPTACWGRARPADAVPRDHRPGVREPEGPHPRRLPPRRYALHRAGVRRHRPGGGGRPAGRAASSGRRSATSPRWCGPSTTPPAACCTAWARARAGRRGWSGPRTAPTGLARRRLGGPGGRRVRHGVPGRRGPGPAPAPHRGGVPPATPPAAVGEDPGGDRLRADVPPRVGRHPPPGGPAPARRERVMTDRVFPGAVWSPPDNCHFLVWAPRADRVVLRLTEPVARDLPMRPMEDGYHQLVVKGVSPGQKYLFALPGGVACPDPIARPDPASRWQPDGVHGPSAVVDPRFAWGDGGWRGIALKDMVLYELHVGTFTPEGTFDAAIGHLDRLCQLGVNAIEVMPVAQFPGGRNWGYDGVYPFCVQNSYGGAAGLKRLVDAAHRRGVAVVLDVVYNHLGPEGNYLREFGPYFTDHYRTPWGEALNFDGADSDHVRHFFLTNALMWQDEFRLDGLRLDATHAIKDTSALPFLTELAEQADREARRLGRPFHLIAESDANDARLVRPRGQGGFGLAASWADDFHHAAHTLLTGERAGYYQDFGELSDLVWAYRDAWVYAGRYSPHRRRQHGNSPKGLGRDRFVVCAQNHDQVGNRARGERLSALVDRDGLGLAAGLVLLSPFVPLLFMGEEYGETAPFLFFTSHGDPGLIEAVRRGRREEFASFGWQGEVPDPQGEETFARSKLDPSRGDPELLSLYRELIALRRTLPLDGEREVIADEERQALRVWYHEGSRGAVVVFQFGAGGECEWPWPAGEWRRVFGPELAPCSIRSSGRAALTLPGRQFVVYRSVGEGS
ncbi:MAG: maltose alpha-D-glucosyltransferase [Gemmataceae bacterium]